MAIYVALVRGVGPANPNLRNEKLGAVLKAVGCTEVRPVLASGNLVFRSAARSAIQLETRIERAFTEQLGVSADVIVLTQLELKTLLNRNPFNGAEHGGRWYLTVTFRKNRQPPVFSQLERAKMDGPAFMLDLEQRLGKQITTRTWNTLLKIAGKMAGERQSETGDRCEAGHPQPRAGAPPLGGGSHLKPTGPRSLEGSRVFALQRGHGMPLPRACLPPASRRIIPASGA